jgi:hypothetical protein
MTKREYFAAVALQGLLSNPNVVFRDHWSAEEICRRAIQCSAVLVHEFGQGYTP